MARRLILPFAVMVCLVSCTNTKNYEANLDTWIGKSEKELVTAWGIPDKQYQLDQNTKMISYISRDTAVYPGSPSTCFGTVSGNTVVSNCGGSFPPTIQSYYCETIFTLDNGRISRWGHKGNNCRS